MKGLGDLIAKMTSLVGIKPKEGCGCKKRQETLNEAVPFPITDWAAERERRREKYRRILPKSGA